MKNIMSAINPHIIKNKEGKKLGVFIDMHEYEKLLDAVEDLYLGAVATAIKKKKEPTKSLNLK